MTSMAQLQPRVPTQDKFEYTFRCKTNIYCEVQYGTIVANLF